MIERWLDGMVRSFLALHHAEERLTTEQAVNLIVKKISEDKAATQEEKEEVKEIIKNGQR